MVKNKKNNRTKKPNNRITNKKERPTWVMFLGIFFIIMSITAISAGAFNIVYYFLSPFYGINNDSNTIDFITILIGAVSSLMIFIGAFLSIKMKKSCVLFITLGATLAIIKNSFDIGRYINSLSGLMIPAEAEVAATASKIAGEILTMILWMIIIILYSRKSFKDKLSK
ncbi:MAG: hypothetical protein WC867_01335 [Candidatus Pacearchaeota archaeon]|jgi:hypothetical protein